MDFLLNKPHESRASYRSTEAGDNRIERLKYKGRESEEIMAHFILDLQRPTWGFPDGSVGKESFCNAGDTSSISGSGRSPGGGHGNTLQYCGLENPMDRGAWWATVHGVVLQVMQTALGWSHSLGVAGFSMRGPLSPPFPDASTPGAPPPPGTHHPWEALRAGITESVRVHF